MLGIPGKCVDDKGAGTANGTTVELFTCDGTTAQNWTIEPDGTVRILGKCLTVGGQEKAGSPVILSTCQPGASAQQWNAPGWDDIFMNIGTASSYICLADPGDSSVDRTALVVAPCTSDYGDPGQLFRVW
jgi:hypothetical protein